MAQVERLANCAQCGAPLPPQKSTGRPRRFCKDECRYAFKEDRRRTGWHSGEVLASFPTDPLTHQRRTLEVMAEMLEGRPAAPPEDQLAQALIELQQITFTLRRLEPEVAKALAGPTGLLVATITDGFRRAFPTLAA